MNEDYVGQKFGKLTIIAIVEKRDKFRRIVCKCACECGNEKDIPISHLKNGSTKSCGCLLRRNLTGQVFGRLRAIAPTDKRFQGCIVWRCECACGKDVEVLSRDLTLSRVRSCGCLLIKDLTGQVFGRLRAIAPKEKRRNKNVVWQCECECGQEVEVRSSNLINGNTKSCGCLLVKDIAGETFGKLSAIAPTDKRSNSSIIWQCKCECGNETEVPCSSLIHGRTKSCGCLSKEINLKKAKKMQELNHLKLRQLTMEEKAYVSNTTTGIRNISYQKRNKHKPFRVAINREEKTYRQSFETLDEALHAKEIVFEKYKRKEVNWNDKL